MMIAPNVKLETDAQVALKQLALVAIPLQEPLRVRLAQQVFHAQAPPSLQLLALPVSTPLQVSTPAPRALLASNALLP